MIRIPEIIPKDYLLDAKGQALDLSSIDLHDAINLAVGHSARHPSSKLNWLPTRSAEWLQHDIDLYNSFIDTYGFRATTYTWTFGIYETIKLNMALALIDPSPYIRGWAVYIIKEESK